MSLILASMAAMAGTQFDCEVVTRKFSVFAPAEEVTLDYRGNVVELYTFGSEDMPFGESAKLDQVFDGLPYNLFLQLQDETGSPVEITISDLDEDAHTARVEIMEDMTPQAAKTTMIGLEGECTFSRTSGEEANQ